ncbi:MAG: sigma-54 dependent transcriptional regulator [Nitrospirota bacterium]
MGAGSHKKTLLIIDDDKLLCDAVKDYFGRNSIEVLIANSGGDGLAQCGAAKVDVVLLDQNLPDAEGHTLCPSILKHNEQSKIIFITAHPSFDGAIKAIRAGAHDYLSKPFELEELSLAIGQALKTLALEKVAQVEDYKSHKASEGTVLIGQSDELLEIARLVELASTADVPVLITGETGTGKNVVAKAVHYKSTARKDAFISINCAALPENLIEAELFGYEKGAFTGAATSKRGIFEMAEGGTLLLDEIGEMPMHLQSKLLSVLEDKQIKRLGGDTIRPVDVRIVAATSADLENVLGKTFRSDLYYRLSVIRVHIPPLRERRISLCSAIISSGRSPSAGMSGSPKES